MLHLRYFSTILFLLIFFSCKNSIEKINLVTSAEHTPVESTKDAEIIYSDSAKVEIVMLTPRADRYVEEKTYVEFPEGVKLIFYDSLQQVESQLTANYGIDHVEENIMEVKNNVVVINKKGEQLNTEHLIWDQEKALVYTEEFVKITTEDEVIYGKGLESKEDFTQYKIKNIKGTINIKEDDDEEIE